MARLAALGRVHSDGTRRRPEASAGNSIPVFAPKPKARSVRYCSAGASRVTNFAIAMLLETRIASASVSEGSGCSSVIVRPGSRYLPPSPETWSVGATRRRDSRAAAAKIFTIEPGSNVSVNALGRVSPSRCREASARTSPVPGSSMTTSPPSASMRRTASSSARRPTSCRAEPSRDERAVGGGIAQLIGRDADVIGLLAEAEWRAVTIEQRAAPRRQYDALGALRLRLLRPATTLPDLHLGRASGQEGQPDKDADFHHLEAHGGLRH